MRIPQPFNRTPSSLLACVRRAATFRNAVGGSVAVWAAVALPTLSVGAAVTVDVSRLQALDNDLQSAADALAKAGAAELDQAPDSILRAKRAVNTLLSNTKRAGENAGSDVTVQEVRFLRDLPTPRWSENTDAVLTHDATEARYVEVRVDPETVGTLFPVSLSGKFADVTLSARATAGLDVGVCGSAPVFICNPFEGSDMSFAAAASSKDFQRKEISFISNANGNGTYSPGNFGWLDPFENNSGASVLVDAIARDQTDVCVSKSRGVHLRPGRIASMRHGVNTRFDLYEGPFKKYSNDPVYAPAQNVVKGYAPVSKSKGNGKKKSVVQGDVCKPEINSAALGMPQDSGHDAELGARIGNGYWDFYSYMRVNHPGFNSITIEDVTYRLSNRKGGSFSPSTPPSRYAMYRWEIDNNCVPGAATYGQNAVTPEEGLPRCNTSGPSRDEDRRVISVAVVNCTAVQASGISMNGRAGPVPVEGFARVFLTAPMGQGSQNVLRGEVVGLVDPRHSSMSRDRVALVR